ncbi:MAG: UDP-N-acetylmuramoyl-L-alanine--D-glutamate ligase [bacterium]|nr:UDP-N-acetylmuramoyl-L-alanine--D-glutamate ligase [bacterium]
MYTPGYFKGKKITVMGLGLLGRGVGDVAFLAEEGAELIVTDLKSKEELASSLESLKNFKNITYVLGEHRLEDFRNRDFILKAASVPLESPYIAEAQKNNIPVEMSSSLFVKLSGVTAIGITGTRGKSTVTHLLYEILTKASARSDLAPNAPKIFLGGNIKGVSTLQYLKQAQPGDIAVLELDSWQLQGFGESKISPHVSIFTTFLPDHLNYYGGDISKYFYDKAHIFRFHTNNDYLILGHDVDRAIKQQYRDIVKSKTIQADPHTIASWNILMPGEHNRWSAALAYEAAKIFTISETIIKEVVEQFKGVPGRLEFVKEYKGIRIYNDTNATSPDAALAGLEALKNKDRNIVLIMGGADKNLDMTKLVTALPQYCKSVVLLPGTGTDRIKGTISGVLVAHATDLADAVTQALSAATVGDTLLFSPAFASFGLFKNEYDRGDQFNACISAL